MLAFNLGVFFRNLHGQEVEFSAQSGHGEVHFVGSVRQLEERTELTRHLSVVLGHDRLTLRIEFEEGEEPEEEEADNPEVEVRLMENRDGEERLLLRTTFAFDEIRLQPVAPEVDEPASETG